MQWRHFIFATIHRDGVINLCAWGIRVEPQSKKGYFLFWCCSPLLWYSSPILWLYFQRDYTGSNTFLWNSSYLITVQLKPILHNSVTQRRKINERSQIFRPHIIIFCSQAQPGHLSKPTFHLPTRKFSCISIFVIHWISRFTDKHLDMCLAVPRFCWIQISYIQENTLQCY
jgi:hypothetical protein